MKFIRLISLLLIGAALYQSCTSTLNPNAPYKNITVVYGLLSITDTVHYIKIEKAFLTQAGNNAYTAAQVADSIYYPQSTINASLQAYSNGSPVGSAIPLTYIDGTTIGQPKQAGTFANQPNIIYYTKATLDTGSYKLIIRNTQTGRITSAATNIVDTFLIAYPTRGQIAPVDFSPANNNLFGTSWQNSVNAALFQLVIRFHYRNITATDSTDTLITWSFPPVANTGAYLQSYNISGKAFYSFVGALIPPNPAVKRRRAISFDFWYYGGGQELATYQQISFANSTSLVEGQINPTYTNITNGLGLLSSTVFEPLNGFKVGGQTMDSLACEPATAALNFYNEYNEPCGGK